MANLLSRANAIITKYPIYRGMLIYSVTWPTGSIIQQTMAGESIDWKKTMRFFIYGTFYVAPTLYAWVKLSSAMWPQTNFRTGLTKAVVEQFSYGPFAGVSFFLGISLLEFKTFKEATTEVCEKFPAVFKVGICVWPVIQTINFTFIAEKNRVPFVSMCSLLWTTYLAYMKQLETKETQKLPTKIQTKDEQNEEMTKPTK